MTNEEHTNDAQGATAEEAKVEKMFEYGYRKSNYGPDELVTDAHGNPISVVDAMLSAEDAAKAETSTPHLCYYSPRIPGNTGSAIRLCAVTGTILHLVEPLGFNLRDTKLRRAGLDYHDMAHVVLHPNFENLVESMPNSRIIAFTAHATKLYTDIEYKPTDILPGARQYSRSDGYYGRSARGRTGASADASKPAFPEPHQLRIHRHLRSLAPTRLRRRPVIPPPPANFRFNSLPYGYWGRSRAGYSIRDTLKAVRPSLRSRTEYPALLLAMAHKPTCCKQKASVNLI